MNPAPTRSLPASLTLERLIVACLHQQGIDTRELAIHSATLTSAFILIESGILDEQAEREQLADLARLLLLHSPWATLLEKIDSTWFLWVGRRLDEIPPPETTSDAQP